MSPLARFHEHAISVRVSGREGGVAAAGRAALAPCRAGAAGGGISVEPGGSTGSILTCLALWDDFGWGLACLLPL